MWIDSLAEWLDFLPPLIWDTWPYWGIPLLLVLGGFCLHAGKTFSVRRVLRALARAGPERRLFLLQSAARHGRRLEKVRERLFSILRHDNRIYRRMFAFDCLLTMGRTGPSGDLLRSAFELALHDSSRSLRKGAILESRRLPGEEAFRLLNRALSEEPEEDLKKAIVTALCTLELGNFRRHIEEEDFDRAEASVRRLAGLGFPDGGVEAWIRQIAFLRENRLQRLASTERARREERARACADLAARSLKKGAFDRTEKLAKAALVLDASNERGLRILEHLPALRQTVDENRMSRLRSERLRYAEALRAQASDLLERQDYDAATGVLLRLAPLEPADGWARSVLGEMPRLQEQARRAMKERETNEWALRVGTLHVRIPSEIASGRLEEAALLTRELSALVPKDKQAETWEQAIAAARKKREEESLVQAVQAFAEQGDLDRAERELNKLALISPNAKLLNRLRGFVAALRQERRRAEEKRVAQMRAERKARMEAGIHGFLQSEDYVSACAKAKEMAALFPADDGVAALVEHCRELAEAAAERSRIQEAYGLFQQSVREGDFDTAESRLRALVALAPNRKEFRGLLKQLPELRHAEEVLRYAAAKVRNRRAAEALLGECHALLGQNRFEECLPRLQRAAELSPSDSRIPELLGRIGAALELAENERRIRERTPLNEFGEIVSA